MLRRKSKVKWTQLTQRNTLSNWSLMNAFCTENLKWSHKWQNDGWCLTFCALGRSKVPSIPSQLCCLCLSHHQHFFPPFHFLQRGILSHSVVVVHTSSSSSMLVVTDVCHNPHHAYRHIVVKLNIQALSLQEANSPMFRSTGYQSNSHRINSISTRFCHMTHNEWIRFFFISTWTAQHSGTSNNNQAMLNMMMLLIFSISWYKTYRW